MILRGCADILSTVLDLPRHGVVREIERVYLHDFETQAFLRELRMLKLCCLHVVNKAREHVFGLDEQHRAEANEVTVLLKHFKGDIPIIDKPSLVHYVPVELKKLLDKDIGEL